VKFLERVSLPPLREKVLKALLKDAIMVSLRDGLPLSGYDLILKFNEEFDINLSPGTVYSTINYMERDGLIKSEFVFRKRVYTLTNEGNKALDETLDDVEELNEFIHDLLMRDG
jgi:DNA-binding PadR family transcriptional regulator